MTIENFYSFSSKLSSSTVQVHPVGLSIKEDSNGLFEQHKLIQGLYAGIHFPVLFKQEYGKKLEDVLDTGWAGFFLISDRMKTSLENNNLTGWKTFSVKVLDKQGQEIKGYHGFSIIGKCGPIDYSKSETIEKQLVPNGPSSKYYKGLHVGLDKWDSCDFFLPEKYFGTIVTQRAAEVLKKNKVSNVRLENVREIEIPEFAL